MYLKAGLISPPSPERYHVGQRMHEALAAVGDGRTIAILLEQCRLLPGQARQMDPKHRQEALGRQAGEIRRTIRAIGGKEAVLGLLECARIAEAADYGGDGPDSARSFVVYLLSSSRHPRALAENPEWAESLRDPENPTQLVPWDDKWKEFKPVIEGMLENPGNLDPEDIQTLQSALAAMPR